MRCISIARGTGKRCKNEATDGRPFCDVSQHNPRNPTAEGTEDALAAYVKAQGGPAMVGQGEPDGPDPEPEPDPEPPAPEPTHSEPARAEISSGRRVGAAEIPRAPDPEREAAASRPEPERDVDEIASRIPPHIFRQAGVGGADAGRGPEPVPSSSPEPSSRPSAMRAAATPGTVGRVVIPTIDRGFKALGWAQLEADEAEAGAEIIAAAMADAFEGLDPEDPKHQLMLWTLFVVGSRAVPDVAARMAGKARARLGLGGGDGPAPAERNGDHPPAAAADPAREARDFFGGDEGDGPAGGWGPLEVIP